MHFFIATLTLKERQLNKPPMILKKKIKKRFFKILGGKFFYMVYLRVTEKITIPFVCLSKYVFILTMCPLSDYGSLINFDYREIFFFPPNCNFAQITL